ncbi:TorF family putative porin [Microbulbifer sp. S227A]|uniref:TorF family putative porin n=1 Tax=Microbulbifer sp. S227A TaxID=3415131 RepID=UPI003C7C31FD
MHANATCGIIMACTICAAGASGAQDTGAVRYVFGVDVVSNYVSNGRTQSDGKPAIQPYFEVELNGFYAGTWLSNVDFGDNDDWEIDLYVGYRNLFANDLFMDVGYARYLYDDSGDCCGEAKLTLGYPLTDQFGLTGYVAYDPRAGNFNRSVTLAYEPTAKLGFAGIYGYSDSNAHEYWSVGASYTFDDTWSAGVRYEGSGSGDEGLVFRVSLGNLQTPLFRLLGAPFQR